MKKIIFILALFVSASAFLTSCADSKNNTDDANAQMAEVYQCPMDCESGKTYDAAGKCPVCGMDLAKVEHTDGDGHDHDADGHHHDGEGDHTHSSDSMAAPAN